MCALAEWACPVTDDEIRAYAETLVRTSIKLGKEDRDEAVKRLTEWRDKYEPSYRVQQAIERRREAGL
jgi:hypothetical protein